MDETIFRILVAALIVGFVAHRGYYTRKVQHADSAVVEQPNLGLSSQVASLLALPALIATALYVFVPVWIAWAALPLPIGVRWLGVSLAVAGGILLQWAQNTLGKNWSDAPKLVSDQAMVARGPYAWIRHPIYTAFLLILGSLLLISANWLVGGLWLVSTSLDIAARIRAEEKMLLGQFGESYRAYMQRTGQLLPRLSRSKSPDS